MKIATAAGLSQEKTKAKKRVPHERRAGKNSKHL